MTIVQKLKSCWASFWGDPVMGGLSVDEYEEYECLWACYEWRRLSRVEQERLEELEYKRGIDD